MNAQIAQLLFETPWSSCTLTLSSGHQVRVGHPDYLLMPRHRQWVLYVPNESDLQFIPLHQIASVHLRRKTGSKPSAATKGA